MASSGNARCAHRTERTERTEAALSDAQGNQSQSARVRALGAFKRGTLTVRVAPDGTERSFELVAGARWSSPALATDRDD